MAKILSLIFALCLLSSCGGAAGGGGSLPGVVGSSVAPDDEPPYFETSAGLVRGATDSYSASSDTSGSVTYQGTSN